MEEKSQEETRAKLLGSLLLFTQTFYKIRTGRDFELSKPDSRESHYITISRALTKSRRGESTRLMINVPPRYGKTEMCIHYIAWCIAAYPDSHFLYVSYSHTLAAKQTQVVRQIISLPEYRDLFGIQLSKDSSAKDNFHTTDGGSVYAAGAGGTITGQGAGIQNCDRFGGAIIIDDIHKPAEVTSDTIRQGVIDWYPGTLQSRFNSPDTPCIFIGQRLHEEDLPAKLLDGYDGYDWDKIVVPALDKFGNALNPKQHTKERLMKMKETMPYEFASQYMQDPQPAGGGIYKPEWFPLLDAEPDIITTFITVDAAETDKTYNDATVFSLFGIYEIKHDDITVDDYALHWMDCHECRVEPKDLRDEFMNCYSRWMRHDVKPRKALIEKKSSGVTLVSLLKDMQGLQVIPLTRADISGTHTGGGKTARFLRIQPTIASKLVSLPRNGRHTQIVLEHMKKITANNSHRHDDIADTLADAVLGCLIDKIIQPEYSKSGKNLTVLKDYYRSVFRK